MDRRVSGERKADTALLTLWIRLFALAACAAVLSRCRLGIVDRCTERDKDGKERKGRGFA